MINFTEIRQQIATWKSERKASRKEQKPLRLQAAREIRERVLDVLKMSFDSAEQSRKYGLQSDPWFSVGLMTCELRQTGKGWTGEAFHRLNKADQCEAVRQALEFLKREGKITRAIGQDYGRECYQYQFGKDE